jgi:glutathione-regulated potassium-efflux system ancillary protein KefC
MPFLYTLVVLLVAAILLVPLAKRLGVGSVLGYLAAGLIIGPAGLGLITDVENIASVSELGVVMLLFLIGLELRPARLWTMRRSVFGMGLTQVVVTTAALSGLIHLAGLAWAPAVVVGFALSMSSTAIVLPMLAERDLLTSQAGRDAFSVLLFQDLAVIPVVALIPLLGGSAEAASSEQAWIAVAKGFAALLTVMVGGRYLIRPLFRLIDSAKTPEIFTATALVVVIGTGLVVSAAGLSMSLGAFIAGVLLSDSEYRHEVRADIEPFEGLLLGIFFISVGMSANIAMLMSRPGFFAVAIFGLVLLKAAICFVLARFSGHGARDAFRFATALAQAGEFAFVILAVAVANMILTPADSQSVTLIVTASMLLSPLLFWAEERWLAPRLAKAVAPVFDDITPNGPVIICGFGRVGQIVGRILRMRGIPFTALDKNAEQVATVRRYGNLAFYGDSTRLDLLRAAGAEDAKVLVIALDEVGESLTVAELAQRHFPHLDIYARARNRRHVYLLRDRGVDAEHIIRETFHSSLRLSRQVLGALGVDAHEADRTAALFEERDERMLRTQYEFYEDETQLIQTTKQISDELQGLLEADRESAEREKLHAVG